MSVLMPSRPLALPRSVFSRLTTTTKTNNLRRPILFHLQYQIRHIKPSITMGSIAPSSSPDPAASTEPRKLKILMLHGYTQSSPLFHAKTRSLEKVLHKAFPATHPPNPRKAPKPPIGTLPNYPGGIELLYTTAPHRLQPADIPGFQVSAVEGGGESEAYGWWRRETGSGLYTGVEGSLDAIAETIRAHRGIDAVIGFSQGGACAAFVASLLEEGREKAFEKYSSTHPDSVSYPKSFQGLRDLCADGKGLKFAVSYSGFGAPNQIYEPFYNPKITTPFLNVIGSLDSVVEERRAMALVEGCAEESRKVVVHPGGHFVPVGKDMAGVLVGFLRGVLEEKREEVGVEDMDVPF